MNKNRKEGHCCPVTYVSKMKKKTHDRLHIFFVCHRYDLECNFFDLNNNMGGLFIISISEICT